MSFVRETRRLVSPPSALTHLSQPYGPLIHPPASATRIQKRHIHKTSRNLTVSIPTPHTLAPTPLSSLRVIRNMSNVADSGKKWALQCTGVALETVQKHSKDEEITLFAVSLGLVV